MDPSLSQHQASVHTQGDLAFWIPIGENSSAHQVEGHNRSDTKANTATSSHDRQKARSDHDWPTLDSWDYVEGNESTARRPLLPHRGANRGVRSLPFARHRVPKRELC